MPSHDSSLAIRLQFLESLNEQLRQEVLRRQAPPVTKTCEWPKYLLSGLAGLLAWSMSWMH